MLLALVGSAHASDILTPPVTQPPHTVLAQESATDGSSADDTTETMTEIALDMFAVLPSLF